MALAQHRTCAERVIHGVKHQGLHKHILLPTERPNVPACCSTQKEKGREANTAVGPFGPNSPTTGSKAAFPGLPRSVRAAHAVGGSPGQCFVAASCCAHHAHPDRDPNAIWKWGICRVPPAPSARLVGKKNNQISPLPCPTSMSGTSPRVYFCSHPGVVLWQPSPQPFPNL